MVAGTQNSRSLCGLRRSASCSGISPISTSYDDGVPGRWSMPSAVLALPCGSRSITSTCSPCTASAAARFTAVVVLPTPPFWLAMVKTRRARPGHPCRSGVQHRRAPARPPAIGVQPGCGDVSRETSGVSSRAGDSLRHSSALRTVHLHPSPAPQTRSHATTTVLGRINDADPARLIRGCAAQRGDAITRRCSTSAAARSPFIAEHHAHPGAQRQAPRGEPVNGATARAIDHVGSPPSPAHRRVLGTAPHDLDVEPEIVDHLRRNSTRRASGSTRRRAGPAGPAPTVSRAGPLHTDVEQSARRAR